MKPSRFAHFLQYFPSFISRERVAHEKASAPKSLPLRNSSNIQKVGTTKYCTYVAKSEALMVRRGKAPSEIKPFNKQSKYFIRLYQVVQSTPNSGSLKLSVFIAFKVVNYYELTSAVSMI